MTVYYLCHINEQRPYGGVRVIYRQVDILNAAGIDAAVVHGLPGFRCNWFANNTRVTYPPLQLGPGDLLALPEALAPLMPSLAPGIPKVVMNQNAYNTWHGVVAGNHHPYLASNDDLVGVTCISEQNRQLLSYSFPQLQVTRIWYSLDAAVFHADNTVERPQRLAYMPRKRPEEARQVLGILASRGALEGWEVVALDGLTQNQVATELRRCSLFLSFSEHEGCPLPPVEALASGCFVIGYTGFGAREYFDPRFTIEVADGDVMAFAIAVEGWVKNDGHQNFSRGDASAHALTSYSGHLERQSVLDFFHGALARTSAQTSPAGSRSVQHEALFPGDLEVGARKYYRRARRAARLLISGY